MSCNYYLCVCVCVWHCLIHAWQCTVQGKVNAVSAEMEKVRAESKRKEERIGRLARESEKQSKRQTDKVWSSTDCVLMVLYNVLAVSSHRWESLKRTIQGKQSCWSHFSRSYPVCMLSKIPGKLEQEVGGRRDSLAAEERQLRVGTVLIRLTEVMSFIVITHLCRARCRKRCL